ncbi:hypothetical protein BHM03_00015780 [Ensete ventricosum]|uniref:Uncharacterized protein n=1 Tax=Ensete ventricosum TaxID=4639 RepID=A0A426YN16_ENSVE|nr:hypothetical protein B296_00013961 [Ensete ventricosum]RZR88239.1 hypothetical protein BHM03_00015780 [Ensete ventricosum]
MTMPVPPQPMQRMEAISPSGRSRFCSRSMMGQRSSVYLRHRLSLLSSIDNSHIFPCLLFSQMKLQEKATHP